MSQRARSQFFRVYFAKPKLDCGIALFFGAAYLCNVTWPSFDDRHRMCDALLIEDLGHADLLSNKPFQHTLFSPYKEIYRDCQPGWAASSPGNAVKQSRGMSFFVYPAQEPFLRCRNSRAANTCDRYSRLTTN